MLRLVVFKFLYCYLNDIKVGMYGSDFCNDVFSALNMEPSLDEWDGNELKRKASRALSYFCSYITNEVKEVFIHKSYEQGFVFVSDIVPGI